MSTKNVISKNGVWKTAPLNDTPSSGGVLVVTDTDGTLDKTWQEIHDAMLVGGVVLSLGDTRVANISGVDYSERNESYVVSWCNAGAFSIGNYTASSADGYPTAE